MALILLKLDSANHLLFPSVDIHPDQFYKVHSSTEEGEACHRGQGPAGILGAETSDCDSPISLVNATFKWIDENLKDSIDFVIWTGDSARHDNDEIIPRTVKDVEDSNTFLVNKFVEVFGKDDSIHDADPIHKFIIPIVPTLGNNDILPHNIMDPGPNRWTKSYLSIWRSFIPEAQRHSFERGGWFFAEVIPNHLAVFNLNTLYFFNNNAAVDGCAHESEIGYEQMDWLRIQLQFLRQRGMKAILMGHVAPARTDAKRSWDETCWQKYTLWMYQYRDVVVGSLYGHMNIEHFLLQDSEEVNERSINGVVRRTALDDEMNIQSSVDYLSQLQRQWSRLPYLEHVTDPKKVKKDEKHKSPRKKKESKYEKYYKKIGGEWGERYSVSLISPSVVPNYFPTIRVIEYNISGLDAHLSSSSVASTNFPHARSLNFIQQKASLEDQNPKKDDKKHKTKKPSFTPPLPPSKSSPPGPAYSPQTFTWLGYTQYYANLTRINNDFPDTGPEVSSLDDSSLETEKWHRGKHSGKKPSEGSRRAKRFVFEVEYDTRKDKVYGLKDLTVLRWIELAGRIGKYKSCEDVARSTEEDDKLSAVSKKKKDRERRKRRKAINKTWFAFVSRAFVGTRDEDEIWDDFS